MPDYDLIVIGGGPAGYAAALTAADRGASVALIEAESPGGSCVHHACIPTNIMLASAGTFVESRELGVMGVFDVGDDFNFARATARKNALVKQMAEGIRTALRMRKVALIEGRARFTSPSTVEVAQASGASTLSAEAFVITTGARWHPPAIPGVSSDRILTPDQVQALPKAPASALVLLDGPADVPFGLEYAAILAIAGSQVTVTTSAPRLLPALDATLTSAARSGLEDLGITVIEGASVAVGQGNELTLRLANGQRAVPAEVIVAADTRRPFFESLDLPAAGVETDGRIPVDRRCETNVPGIFAAGDVTGGIMLSSAASHMGEVAATNATGGRALTRLGAIPRLLHTVPGIAWIGLTEEAAKSAGHDVRTGVFDLSYNARAITLGARTGIVKVVAERQRGEILGAHAVGPDACEMISVAAALMQAEATVHELAAMVAWHPSLTEGLVEAARRAIS